MTYTCVCGDTYTETVDAIGHNYVDGKCEHCGEADSGNPNTGNTNLWGVALVAMTSMVAVVTCFTKKRKN